MSKYTLFMSGLPGRMATAVAEAAQEADDVNLVPASLTGAEDAVQDLNGEKIELIHHSKSSEFIDKVKATPGAVVVDYTHPSAVRGNVELYTQNKIPFILGTTGGDYGDIEKLVVDSETPAVIAPNMALPIVAITSMLSQAREDYPGVFDGYELTVKESHQKGKADTSGTAKALIGEWQGMGADFKEDNLNLCRDPELQKKEWGIPDEYMTGHAYHTYDLHSNDGTAHFSLSHNILGRKIYALGTIDALRFLSKRLDDPVTKSYNMIDVLRNLRK